MSIIIPTSALRAARGSYRPAWARHLASFAPLSREDDALLAGLATHRQCAGQLQAASDAPTIICAGWCARVSYLRDGRRQIVNLLVPGDFFGLRLSGSVSDALPVIALTSVILADATPLSRAVRLRSPAHARLAESCERAALAEQRQLINQVTRLGQRTAYERVAHLLLELNFRLEVVGLSQGNVFDLPVRQPDLASTVGLSAVHLNRVLRSLRKDKLIQLRQRSIALLDIAALASVADYDLQAADRPAVSPAISYARKADAAIDNGVSSSKPQQ